jgi:hypothetical protein
MNETLQQFIYNPVSHTVDKSWLYCLVPAAGFGIWSFLRRKRVRRRTFVFRWIPRVVATAWFVFPFYQGYTRRVSDYMTVRVDLVEIELLLVILSLVALIICLVDALGGDRPSIRSSEPPPAGAAGGRSP